MIRWRSFLRSMTGFGRAEAERDGRKIMIEIKAVNHRFLDINIRMPRSLGFTEESIRKTIKGNLSRGRVDVYVNYSALRDDAKTAKVDLGLIRSFLDAARVSAEQTGITDDLQLSDIVRIPDAILIEEAAEDEQQQTALVDDALDTALGALTDMRQREGDALGHNLLECLDALGSITETIDSRKDDVPKVYSERLKQRIAELLEGCEVDPARFNTEVAYIADKADITEEIVRLKTHIQQFKSTMSKDIAVGRKLDFIVQEMNREMNTIGSKSQDMQITNAVIEGKSVLEKIREQVQNIE